MMKRVFTTRLFGVSPLGVTTLLCSIGVSLPGLAATPASKSLLPPSPVAPSRPAHLDLRLPASGDYAALKKLSIESRPGRPAPDEGLSSDDRRSFPAFESAAHQPPIVGRAQALAQRFRHEGLPLAHLWENHSAFVSLGLNGRGKPGIWLVQKTH